MMPVSFTDFVPAVYGSQFIIPSTVDGKNPAPIRMPQNFFYWYKETFSGIRIRMPEKVFWCRIFSINLIFVLKIYMYDRWMGAFGSWSPKRELGFGNVFAPQFYVASRVLYLYIPIGLY